MHAPHRSSRLALLASALLLILPSSALAADLHATPATLQSVVGQAQSGDRVLLASGSYGTFSGAAKAGTVTLTPEAGASPTMRLSFGGSVTNLTIDGVGITGATFGSGVRNVTVKNATFTGYTEVNPGSSPMNLVLDNDRWGNVGQGTHEGRLSFAGGSGDSGVQVRNSTFGPGGCSDGIQVSSSANIEIGPGNEFTGIVQRGCDTSEAHVDAIQVYGADNVDIHDNYLHDNEQGIMSPDGPASGYTIKNNVIHTSTGYPCMHIGDNRNSTITHNVCLNGSIRLYGGNQGVASQNITAQNNVAGIDNSACSGCTVDHNVSPGQVDFAGGAGRCAYAVVSALSPGSDGTPVGLNDCTAGPPAPDPPPPSDPTPPPTTTQPTPPPTTTQPPPPPPTQPPPPPADHDPVARYSYSPASPVTGQAVTFDATAATCEDAPCTYTWVDDGYDGSGGAQWPLGNGRTLSFTFRGAGTKNVRLTVTDADGDRDATVKAIAVTAPGAPQPPPDDNPTPPPGDPSPPPSDPSGDDTPPDTTIVSGPNGTTTDATPTFTFTSTEPEPAFECRVDAGPWIDCTSPWTSAPLTGGAHTVSVRSTDVAGNTDRTPATRSFTVAAAPPAPRLVLGSATIQPVADAVTTGSAEAFPATASGSGTVTALSVYVDVGSTASGLVAGIYSDDGGRPGTLLTKGTLSGLTSLAWNDVTVPGEPLAGGERYWIAIMGLGDGALRFRDDIGFGCHSEVSRSSALTTLPATWQSGAVWASCDVSARATG